MISKINSIKVINNIVEVSEYLKKSHYTSYYILVDENTKLLVLPVLLKNLKKISTPVILEIKSGEENKNIETCVQIWKQLSAINADRNSLLINLGGGVLCDIGGFAASAYKRGINFINIPTTLLAMVDASIGGKTGLNLNLYKNQIGFFSSPQAVFIYPELLKTLPENEIINGYAEIIKHALIKDSVYWNDIKSKVFENIIDIIQRSIKIKSEVVNQDPFESEKRKILNFGHTVGHALEMLSPEICKRQISHGEAVAAGIICESFISFQITGLPEHDLTEISDFIKPLFPFLNINKEQYQTIFDLMIFDKKNEKNRIKMVLLKSIGEAVLDVNVEKEIIFDAFVYYNTLYK